MDDTTTLILLSLAMFIGSYLAGSVPLAITFSEARLKYATVFGAGLLVGTALAVIIPEGIHSLIAVPSTREASTLGNFVSSSSSLPNNHQSMHDHQSSQDHHHHSHPHGHKDDIEVVRWMGISLVFGFVFMLLVDQIGGGHQGNTNDSGSHRHNITATLGLVVHAAADGIALGAAAASSSKVGVEILIFAAIMLHKAPAAFGLVSFLLHEGFDRNRIRKHLLIFSLAAPILAIITFFCLSQTSKEVLSSINATGIVMLFSGGTFLYVATVHILPELRSMGTTYISAPHTPMLPLPILASKSGSFMDQGQPQEVIRPSGTFVNAGQPSLPENFPTKLSRKHSEGFSNFEVLILCLGCLLPLLLNIGHSH